MDIIENVRRSRYQKKFADFRSRGLYEAMDELPYAFIDYLVNSGMLIAVNAKERNMIHDIARAVGEMGLESLSGQGMEYADIATAAVYRGILCAFPELDDPQHTKEVQRGLTLARKSIFGEDVKGNWRWALDFVGVNNPCQWA